LRLNPAFRAVYQRAPLVSADGWPIAWLANRQGSRFERTCGSDLVDPVCQTASRRGISVYFIGPEGRAQAAAIAVLRQRHPDLIIAGAESPRVSQTPSSDDTESLAARVRASGARLCFVSLGAPKQELLADALAQRCQSVGFMCVGAALDFISGQSRRSPRWLQRAHLEWSWRLFTNPRRLTARYFISACVFLLLVLRQKAAPQ
jgi:exopolysaccharide biosynthesis WecB/TagA/CpsF family protein